MSTRPSDPAVIGYHVYRRVGARPFVRITTSPVDADNHTDVGAPKNASYMVRAIKLEATPSGSYFNASQGIYWPPRQYDSPTGRMTTSE